MMFKALMSLGNKIESKWCISAMEANKKLGSPPINYINTVL